VVRAGERRNACVNSVGKPERNRTHGRCTCIFEDNIKIDLEGMRGNGLDLSDSG
jgi:hypothetical protein